MEYEINFCRGISKTLAAVLDSFHAIAITANNSNGKSLYVYLSLHLKDTVQFSFFFSSLDAVLNGPANPTLEDGFNTRILFLFTLASKTRYAGLFARLPV